VSDSTSLDQFSLSQCSTCFPKQDVVRTFSEEDIEIPIYDIPLRQRVRARWTKFQHLTIWFLAEWGCLTPTWFMQKQLRAHFLPHSYIPLDIEPKNKIV